MDGRSRGLRATVLFHYHSILQRRVVCGTAQTRRSIAARVSNALHSRPMPEDAFFESVSRMPETIQHMKFSAGHDGKLHSRWGLLAVLHTFLVLLLFMFILVCSVLVFGTTLSIPLKLPGRPMFDTDPLAGKVSVRLITPTFGRVRVSLSFSFKVSFSVSFSVSL